MRPRAVFTRPRALVRAALSILAAVLLVSAAQAQQQVSGLERDRWKAELKNIKDDIKKYYYDPGFHGIDLDEHFEKAEEKMSRAQSFGQLFGVIAQALLDFEDSHLFFLPPGRATRYDYGWRTRMVGDRCFITAVKPGSDAEAKGLKPGDEVVSLDGYQPTRQNHWKMRYAYFSLRPVPGVRFVVAKPDGRQQQLDVTTKVTQGKRVLDLTFGGGDVDFGEYIRELDDEERERREASRSQSFGDNQVMLWKLEEFAHTDGEIDGMFAKARKHKALVIDLRGNGGGWVDTLVRMLGHLFDRDVAVGEVKRRKDSKPLTAKTRGGENVYRGDLIVLVDSDSGSASELFARVVQLEKRGTVIGDRTAGAVMRSRQYVHESGTDTVVRYGVSVTDADIIMADGKSLEHTGVKPEIIMLPKAADLAAGRDPVLSQAVTLLGFPLDPEKAGALFPTKWKK